MPMTALRWILIRGEFVAIVGKSEDPGKSTLMNITKAVDVPTSRYYLLEGCR